MRTPSGSGYNTDVETDESEPLIKNNIATRIHREILNNRNRSFQPTSVIFWLSHLSAVPLAAIPAVLYLGLSEDNFKSGVERYVFASASFFVNYVQVLIVQQKTLKRYLFYVKNFSNAIAGGSRGIRQLLKIHESSETSTKIYGITKSIFGFLFKEVIKWTILVYASMLPPSLAKEVYWLNHKVYKQILRASIIIFLQEAVHERIENFKLPAIMPADILQGEIRQFRDTLSSILKFNQYDAMDNQNHHQAQVNAILEKKEAYGLFTHALNISRGCGHLDFFSSNKAFYMGAVITLLLTTFYSAANAGNYSETYSNLADPIEGRIGSIFVDFLFGLYMAIETGLALGFHLRRLKAIIRNHKPEICCLIVAMTISSLTVGSTLDVAKNQGMPLFIKILTIPGTIFDNANFLVLLFFSLILMTRCLKNKDRVKLANFYEQFRNTLDSLSDSEFMDYILDVSIIEGGGFIGYEDYLYQQVRWTEHSSIQNILLTLRDPPLKAASAINQGGRFGLLRRTEELLASLLTMWVCSLAIMPSSSKIVRIILDYICPAASIPIGIITISLFGHYNPRRPPQLRRRTNRATIENIEEDTHAVTINQDAECGLPFVLSTRIKSVLLLAFPVAVKYCAYATSHWVYTHIFKQNYAEAEKASNYTAAAVASIGSFAITKSIAVRMR